jgi:hypothetical protein
VALVVLLVVPVVRLLVVAGVPAALVERKLLPAVVVAALVVYTAAEAVLGQERLVAVLVEAEPLAVVALFVLSTLQLA